MGDPNTFSECQKELLRKTEEEIGKVMSDFVGKQNITHHTLDVLRYEMTQYVNAITDPPITEDEFDRHVSITVDRDHKDMVIVSPRCRQTPESIARLPQWAAALFCAIENVQRSRPSTAV